MLVCYITGILDINYMCDLKGVLGMVPRGWMVPSLSIVHGVRGITPFSCPQVTLNLFIMKKFVEHTPTLFLGPAMAEKSIGPY